MTTRTPGQKLLDNTLCALEQLLLAASDAEVRSARVATGPVARLISKATKGHTAPRRGATSDRQNETGPFAQLRELARANPSLAPRLSIVFRAGRTPSEQEMKDLLKELSSTPRAKPAAPRSPLRKRRK